MNEPITTLYSRSGEEWRRWLNGGALHTCGGKRWPTLQNLIDDLCDAVGGCNTLTIDMGDQALISMPCPSDVRSDGIIMLRVDLTTDGDERGWKVANWGTVGCTHYESQDNPKALVDALAEFLEMELGEDD